MKSFIKSGLVFVPGNKELKKHDLVIEGGRIAEVREAGSSEEEAAIDAEGLIVAPGFIDLHVHFREPGATEKEDIKSGRKAAARGGFTTVCTMPNTDPPMDSVQKVLDQEKRTAGEMGPNVLSVAAITVGQKGRRLSEFELMRDINTRCHNLTGRGIAAISEDGISVMDSRLMREAMYRAAELDFPVFSHCEDPFLKDGSPESETIIAMRDSLLALASGCRLHLCHVSTAGTVDWIRYMKDRGASLTAETAPHYFTLTREDVDRSNGRGKMNPPLGTREDREAIRLALADGTIDAIATDHAPHEAHLTEVPYEEAANGVSGLETAFGLGYTELVEKGILDFSRLMDLMSRGPASILGMDRGRMAPGTVADLVLLDVNKTWQVDPSRFHSKGKNTPFGGRNLTGQVKMTMVEGQVIYHDRSTD